MKYNVGNLEKGLDSIFIELSSNFFGEIHKSKKGALTLTDDGYYYLRFERNKIRFNELGVPPYQSQISRRHFYFSENKIIYSLPIPK